MNSPYTMDADLLARLALTAIALAWLASRAYGVHLWCTRVEKQLPTMKRIGHMRKLRLKVGAGLDGWLWGPPLTFAVIGLGVIWWRWPYAIYAVALPIGAGGLRQLLHAESNDITRLRNALAVEMGTDKHDNPPKVTAHGRHEFGGPKQITVYPLPGWHQHQDKKRKAIEQAVRNTLEGHWRLLGEWDGNGLSRWERTPYLPPKIHYADWVPGLPWNELPAVLDGYGIFRIFDVLIMPHTLGTGATRFGKTTFVRDLAAHLHEHRLPLIALDVKHAGLAFLEGRVGVRCAFGYEQCVAAIDRIDQIVEDRLKLWTSKRQYRTPLFVICDETESLFEEIRSRQKKAPGASAPESIRKFHTAVKNSAKVRVFFVVLTQRPDAAVMGGAMRAQFGHRIGFGKLDPAGAKMLFGDQDWKLGTQTPELPGRAAVTTVDWKGHGQAPWLADPGERSHPAKDRAYAQQVLPPYEDGYEPPDPDAVEDDVSDDELTHNESAFGKVDASSSSDVNADDPGVLEPPKVDPQKLGARKRQARYKQRKLAAMEADPNHEWHGTGQGYSYGCKCDDCKAAWKGAKDQHQQVAPVLQLVPAPPPDDEDGQVPS
jgi:hypothetical protein